MLSDTCGNSGSSDVTPGLITVVGGESTGKSTLVAALADDLPARVVPETLRSWVTHHGRVPTAEEQWQVLELQAEAEQEAMSAPWPPSAAVSGAWVVSDGGPLMTAAYSRLYYGDDTLVPRAVELTSGALIVWCADDIPWEAEAGVRDGPHMRRAAQVVIGDILSAAPTLQWIAVGGSVSDRLAAVRAAL